MKIIGITTNPLPHGTAASERQMLLFRGLKEHADSVLLYSLFSGQSLAEESNTAIKKSHDIAYANMVGFIPAKKSRIIKIFFILKGAIRCFRSIVEASKEELVFVMIFTRMPIVSYLITRLLSWKSIPMIHEVTEFPFLGSGRNRFVNQLYLKKTLKLYEYIFVISDGLQAYYHQHFHAHKIGKLNIVVDISKFEKQNSRVFDFDYIAYCGSMSTDKDGVPTLVQSFAKVKEKYPGIKLVLIGDISRKPIQTDILKAIKQNQLEENVIFTGYIHSKEMPVYLKHAKVLALARPNNIQAKGGFPTKLGEYLATGNPVVVTNVGDIPKFLQDRETAFLTEPNSEDFAKGLLNALSNYSKAIQIGLKGKNVAIKHFNYKSEAFKIHQVLNTLSEKGRT